MGWSQSSGFMAGVEYVQLLTTVVVVWSVTVLISVTTALSSRPPSVSLSHSGHRCLTQRPEVHPKRHFYYNGQNLPIIIETSSRISQMLSSHILKILLTEVLGYEKVDIKTDPSFNSINATDIFKRISGCHSSRCEWRQEKEVPNSMVNLEVWLQAGFNTETWVKTGHLADAGPLGPSGRFGWFMPTATVEDNWGKDKSIIDHWRALTQETTAKQFSLKDKYDILEGFLTHKTPHSKESYCSGINCRHGIMYGSNCSIRRNCAMLLSSYPELDMGMLQAQVKNLQLDVNIAWIGSHLHSMVHDHTKRNLPILFFNWMPNALTAMDNYTRVKFPHCQGDHHLPDDCDFEINQLSKVSWEKLRTHTPEAFHVIRHMTFTEGEYEELLRWYAMKHQYEQLPHLAEETACHWVQQKQHIWKKWIPKNMQNKTKIVLGGMFPLRGPYWRAPGIVPGAQMAVEFVNRDPNVLGDYELVMEIKDTKCKSDIVMQQFVQYYMNESNPIVGILGPGCSETAEPIAGVSKHFNIVIISYGTEVAALANREMYPYFFRTVPQIKQFSDVFLELFKMFDWRQVALLADGQEFPEFHTMLHDKFVANQILVVYTRKMPRQTTSEEAASYVEAIKAKGGRIIIMTSYEASARQILCEASKRGMTSQQGYVWFLPMWFPKNWWKTEIKDSQYMGESYEQDVVHCTNAQMYNAIQGHFMLSPALFGHDDDFIKGNITVRQWRELYLRRLKMFNFRESVYATTAYDAVWVYALALDKLLKEDPTSLESLRTDRTMQRYMYYLNMTKFAGAAGPVRFHGADRTGIINIHQYIRNSSRPIGQYLPDKNGSERLVMEREKIIWMTKTGREPPDGRPSPKVCSIEGFRAVLNVDCDVAIVIANILGVGLFAVVMIICLIIVKRRYDKKVRATRERMKELGLMADAAWLCLDEWEMPRDQVVLNRKLGEGAFGTVYGGEALIGNCWEAVAVKTLKIGSNPEEKLDFLSEAEMMKRFDHQNIVKLLGVCTRGEPIYAVMEFMLHGDLKTFLLARRQLVGRDTKEAEDISPVHLTRMALDVAYGLQYLSNLRYVHRDLACRNCLVHACKAVKLGDFGMTRPMYDSDYYRFTKRGMLPVRWMAPESLADGIFTSMSDIWSYGVLLYEVVTFGSFPYQGLSNKQVLEHVKQCNTLTLPQQCLPELGKMLTQCWSRDPEGRPRVEDIIKILEEHPRLVTPCLDAPLSAVALDGTESLDMALPGKPLSRLRGSIRTIGEHTHLHSTLSQDSRSTNNALPCSNMVSSPMDPFNLNGPTTVWERGRSRHSSLQTSVNSGCSSVAHSHSQPDLVTNKCRRSPSRSRTGSINSSGGSPVHLHYMRLPTSLEERADSDYCSDHSKDVWHNSNHTSVV